MELFNEEISALPGVKTEIISDYKTGYDTSLFGTTDSVLIIGTAFNGPVGKPIKIYSPDHARYVFGKSYDPKTKTEATLLPNIQDAWNTGCRTIIAVRVSGKNIEKVYNFNIDSELSLRVSGAFPSNSNKDVSVLFNIVEQNLSAKIFKPADKATINEKKQGLVERLDSVLVNDIDFTNMELTLESELVDFIKAFNDYPHNNVLRLAIVDQHNNDVTLSSVAAKSLKVKNLFSGLYTIGREETLGVANTIVKVTTYEGSIVKHLQLNSDVTTAYPIYAETKEELSKYLKRPMVEMFDFLKIMGAIDEVFKKDSIDYEEVDLSDFDLYCKLGTGYAINAQVIEIPTSAGKRYKVKEVEDTNPNRKTEFRDGMYSMLQNLDTRYRVLAGVAAETKIKNRLPRKEEFEKAVSKEVNILSNALKIKSVISENDKTKEKAYTIKFDEEAPKLDEKIEEKMNHNVAKIVSTITKDEIGKKVNYKEGSLFLGDIESGKQLYTVKKGILRLLHEDINDALNGNFVIADNVLYVCKSNVFVPATSEDLGARDKNNEIFMTAMLENGSFVVVKGVPNSALVGETMAGDSVVGRSQTGIKTTILGTVAQLFSKEEKVITTLNSVYGTNEIKIYSPDFDVLTVEEVVDMLNADKDFSKLFTVEIVNFNNAQEIIQYVIEEASDNKEVEMAKDRSVVVDINKYIPYRTDDNFTRQLAQHCLYTSIKTAPTHGVIGTKILLDTSLKAVANRVNELVNLRLDNTLVAKKYNGTNLLDEENMPYPVGRKVSVTFGQYIVRTSDNYSYVSNLAAGYAGMVSRLPLDQSSTCQTINVPNPMFELTNTQLATITRAGYVTIKNSYTKDLVITDGITMANLDSPYRRLSASRVSDQVEALIRSACEPFIGKANNLANQNSLRSAIKSKLDEIKGKIIEDYQFKLITDRASNVLGILRIDSAIVPIYEIKEIRNIITVGDKR